MIDPRRIFIWILIGFALGIIIRSPMLGIVIGIALALNEPKMGLNMRGKKIGIGFWISVIILALLVFLFRPWFHGTIMFIYRNPLVILIAIFMICAFYLMQKNKAIASFFVILSIAGLVTLSFSSVIVSRYIVTSIDYNKIDALPETSDIRILPLEVARRYLEDSLQKSREKIGDLDIAYFNNTFAWIAPRVPDGQILYFTEKTNGVMIADATKSDRKTSLITRRLEIGEEMGIFDNIYWSLYLKEFFIDVDNIYYLIKDDKIYTIVPIIRYGFAFPVMIPYYGGIYVIDEQGEIEYHSPSDAPKFLGNNWAYPESLARLYVDSYQYNEGIINAWFLHKDQIQISDVYGQSNRQPFLLPTHDGLKWMIATEPYGESYGIFKIFIIDAMTGRIDMYELDEEETLTGPVRVVSYVRKEFPIIDWSTSTILEPRPYVIRDELFWMLSITPVDYAGVSYTILINAKDNKVHAFEDDNDVYTFMQTGKIADIGPVITEASDNRSEKIRKIEEIQKSLDELKELLS